MTDNRRSANTHIACRELWGRAIFLGFIFHVAIGPTASCALAQAGITGSSSEKRNEAVADKAQSKSADGAKADLETTLEALAQSVIGNPNDVNEVLKFGDGANEIYAAAPREDAQPRLRLIGQPAILPNADANAWLNGAPLSTEQLTGNVVLLDFWALWCGPCIAGFATLNGWQKKYGNDGLVVVAVTDYYGYSWDEIHQTTLPGTNDSQEAERGAVARFIDREKLIFRCSMDTEGILAKHYHAESLPHYVRASFVSFVPAVALKRCATLKPQS
jgi:thiol-disulfide isomerase/thioredoxin